MSVLKKLVAGSVAIAMLGSSALAAEAIRPTMSLVSPASQATSVRAGARLGSPVEQKNDLLGAPLFLIFLGAISITIGTIIIINNHHHDHPTSRG